MKVWVSSLFQRCMNEDGVNSRLMFFLHGVVVAVGTLILSIAFIFAKDKTGYDYVIMSLGGSGGVVAAGRFLTKKGDNKKPEAGEPPVTE